jgi:hypothetical protein
MGQGNFDVGAIQLFNIGFTGLAKGVIILAALSGCNTSCSKVLSKCVIVAYSRPVNVTVSAKPEAYLRFRW